MTEQILTGFVLSLILFGVQVYGSGIAVQIVFSKRPNFTFPWITFGGLATNLIGLLAIHLVIADVERAALCLRVLILAVLFLALFKRRSNKVAEIERLGTKNKSAFIYAVFAATALSFLVLHNVGFDDYAHLEYLVQISETHQPFPLYLEIIPERYEGARYAMFGLLVGALASHVPGAIFFMYYLLGLGVFLALVGLIFEEVTTRSLSVSSGILAVALVAFILAWLGYDNYFNFFAYPMQQSKLLIISGLIALTLGPTEECVARRMIGITLLAGGLLYHLNGLLLAVPVFIYVLIIGILFRRSVQSIFVDLGFLVAALVVVALVGLLTDGGVIRQITHVTTGASSGVISEVPSVFEKIWRSVQGLVNWFQDGRGVDRYIDRVASLELAIPLVVIAVSRFRFGVKQIKLATFGLIIVLVGVVATRMPQQAITGFVKSGPYWTLFDLRGVEIRDGRSHTIVSDEYTGLILKSLGVGEISVLSPISVFQETRVKCRADNELRASGGRVPKVLVNQRYWGEVISTEKTLAKDSQLEWPQSIIRWQASNQNAYLFQAIDEIPKLIRRKLESGIVPLDQVEIDPQCLIQRVEDAPKRQIAWRDHVFMVIDGVTKNKEYKFSYQGQGDLFDLTHQYSDPPVESGNILDERPDIPGETVKSFVATADIGYPLLLIFRLKYGHFGGLGSLNEVTLISN